MAQAQAVDRFAYPSGPRFDGGHAWTIPNLLLHDKRGREEIRTTRGAYTEPRDTAASLKEWQAATEALIMAAEDRHRVAWHLGPPMTTEDEVRLLELQLADIKRQIAYHEGALQDLWMQLMELRARVTAARRQRMGEDGDQ